LFFSLPFLIQLAVFPMAARSDLNTFKLSYPKLKFCSVGFQEGPQVQMDDPNSFTPHQAFKYAFEAEKSVLEEVQLKRELQRLNQQEKEARIKQKQESQLKEAASAEDRNTIRLKHEEEAKLARELKEAMEKRAKEDREKLYAEEKAQKEAAIKAQGLTEAQEKIFASFKAVTGVMNDKSSIQLLTLLEWDLNRAIQVYYDHGENLELALSQTQQIKASQAAVVQPVVEEKTSIQLILPHGAMLSHEFRALDTLWTVYEFVTIRASAWQNKPFYLEIPFPKKILSDSDLNATLKDNGLVPRGTIRIALS